MSTTVLGDSYADQHYHQYRTPTDCGVPTDDPHEWQRLQQMFAVSGFMPPTFSDQPDRETGEMEFRSGNELMQLWRSTKVAFTSAIVNSIRVAASAETSSAAALSVQIKAHQQFSMAEVSVEMEYGWSGRKKRIRQLVRAFSENTHADY